MRKFSVLALLALYMVSASAQMPDLHDRVVTQTGNNYKATFNHKSDNGGTASETWTGKLINGKREGMWKFTGSYNKYMVSSNSFYTGTATVVRTYKNGILHGTYTVNYNMQVIGGRYNMFTGTWIYQIPNTIKETVSGSFVEGKANGTWKIASTKSRETVYISFKDGLLDGRLSVNQQFPELKTEAAFADGYLTYMKTTNPDNWGYEINYGDKDPKELQPQKTVEVSEYLGYWKYYLSGLSLANLYIEKYPEKSSEESVVAKYIVSDYDTYNKLWGDVPADYLASIEAREKEKINNALNIRYQEITHQIDSLYRQHAGTLNEEFRNFLSYCGLSHSYEKQYIHEVIITGHPEYTAFIDSVQTYAGSMLNSYVKSSFEYDADNNYTVKFNKLYAEALDEVKQHHGTDEDLDTALFISIYPTKNGSCYTVTKKDKPYNSWQDFLQKLDRRHLEASLVVTEEDISYYLAWKYGDYVYSPSSNIYSSNRMTYKLKSKDASGVTKEEVKSFVLKYTDLKGVRHYRYCIMTHDGDNIEVTVEDILKNLKNKRSFQKLRETLPF